MKKSNLILESLLHALGVFVYISSISFLIFSGEKIFSGEDHFLMPVFMLLLFVVSASITGLLVLGKPIFLYLNDSKKEAFVMLFTTIGWLVVFMVGIVVVLMMQ